MSIWNLNVNCGITFGEDSRLTVGEKLKSYGATTALPSARTARAYL